MTAVPDTLACVPSLISTTQPNGWVVDHVQCRASRESACAATICAGHDACVNACASMWKWPLWSCQSMGSSIPVPLPKGFGLPRPASSTHGLLGSGALQMLHRLDLPHAMSMEPLRMTSGLGLSHARAMSV